MILLLVIGMVVSLPLLTKEICKQHYPEYETVGFYGDQCWVIDRDNWLYNEPDMEEFCDHLGGHVPSIHCQEEQDAFWDFFIEHGHQYIWLGARRDAEGLLYWDDGTAWDYENWEDGTQPTGSVDVACMAKESWVPEQGKWMKVGGGNTPGVCQITMPGYQPAVCGTGINLPGGTGKESAQVIPPEELCDYYNDPWCPNYEGGYEAGRDQVGFDDEHFQGDYSGDGNGVDDIDSILEEMETGFENEAALWEGQVTAAFLDKKGAYDAVVAAEKEYADRLTDRVSQEGLYNAARIAEEAAHADLLVKRDTYNTAVQAHKDVHADYVEKIDFLNYELFIIQQIRELLGEKIGYVPEQVILAVTPYDDTYDGWMTGYPEIHTSAFSHEQQRFGRRRRRRKKRFGRRRR